MIWLAKQEAEKKQASVRKSRRLNLTRAERAELVTRRLMDAAITVVGQYGYAEASVSRITKLAKVAQGTFYNHFPNRQDLLDQLLPAVGQRMLEFIRDRVEGLNSEADIEVARFKAFFEFLIEVPEFMRILNEAQIFAPLGYAKHIDIVAKNYMRALRRGGVDDTAFSPAELEVVVHIILGARSYISHHFSYSDGEVHLPGEAIYSAYEKLIRFGLFGKQDT